MKVACRQKLSARPHRPDALNSISFPCRFLAPPHGLACLQVEVCFNKLLAHLDQTSLPLSSLLRRLLSSYS